MKLTIPLVSALLVTTMLVIPGSTKAANKSRLTNPFNVVQFKAKPENKELYGNYRKQWLRLTGFELSALHWQQFVAVFINQHPEIYRNNYLEYLRDSQDDWDDEDEEDEEEARPKGSFKQYPPGTIVAKEGFASHSGKPGEPLFLVLMKKHKPGYDNQNGNWEYLKFAPDGSELLRGSAKDPAVHAECAACHINVAERDYIFTTFFSGTIRY